MILQPTRGIMMRCIAAGLFALSFAAPASAAVKSVSANHFEVESAITVPVPPAEAYAALGRVSAWWNKAHTYSGDSANLSMDMKAGGCFCETLPGGKGTIEHMHIVYAQPGSLLRAQGGLGPLQAEAVAATMSWTFKPVAGGTQIIQNYVVAGHVRMNMETLALGVDLVMAEQLSGLQKRLTR
jgi:uncharacterized protein YndB with AHSA1/START domain